MTCRGTMMAEGKKEVDDDEHMEEEEAWLWP